jgi:repressor LexA
MSLEGLTPKQKAVFSAIQEIQRSTGKMPTLEQIRQHLGYSTVSSVQAHADALKQKGYLETERSLRLSHQHAVSIPLVGNVACGAPLLAEENVEAYVSYDEDKLRGDASQYFFLRALGDSMNRAGINEGDFVLVRKADTAEQGKRVVALVGDDATVKKLSQADGYWVLEPESTNPRHKKVIMLEDASIQGVVEGVVRKSR